MILPDVGGVGTLHNVFTGETVAVAEQDGKRSLAAADVFRHFPVALLVGESE